MINVILTVWKRQHLEEQVRALLEQRLPPEEIWVYHCCDHIEPDLEILDRYPRVRYQFNSGDLGYFGRFALGLSMRTPYVCIIDDDVVPSSSWLEGCRRLCEEYDAIISPSGRLIPPGNFRPEDIVDADYVGSYFIGDSGGYSYNRCAADTIVDYGCNSWFLRTEWLSEFWSVRPYSFETGEDIHLSASCARKGIRTLCPRQDEEMGSGNLKKLYGFDALASWKQRGFLEKREEILRYWIDRMGWTPLLWAEQNVQV
ncbi:MAG: glycosyltransferase family 2 protein [Bacteroidetes bacterium]|nr:glycosyltransferase family 2 protein [Bacteroidota bacterium]